jgi:hypothetical protein
MTLKLTLLLVSVYASLNLYAFIHYTSGSVHVRFFRFQLRFVCLSRSATDLGGVVVVIRSRWCGLFYCIFCFCCVVVMWRCVVMRGGGGD